MMFIIIIIIIMTDYFHGSWSVYSESRSPTRTLGDSESCEVHVHFQAAPNLLCLLPCGFQVAHPDVVGDLGCDFPVRHHYRHNRGLDLSLIHI